MKRKHLFIISAMGLTACIGAQISTAHAAAFANGSFELPAIAANTIVQVPSGSTQIAGWTNHGPGLIDWINGTAGGQQPGPFVGAQYINFNANNTAPGTAVSQTFDTVVGQQYRVSFKVGRGGLGAGNISITASARSSTGQSLSSLKGNPPASIGWSPTTNFAFVATTATTTLRFDDTSVDTLSTDVVLDDVSVDIQIPLVGINFTNGSFELPAIAANTIVQVPAGSTQITGWTNHGPGLIDWINGTAGGQQPGPFVGAQYINFNANNTAPGTAVSQTFDTVVGQQYRVSFKVGRGGFGAGNISITASVRSSTGQTLSSLKGNPPASIGWSPTHSFAFVATTATTTLRFDDTSVDTLSTDVVLDDVSVELQDAILGINFSEVTVCWYAVSNRTYQLQYRSELTTNQWVNLGSPLVGAGTTNCVADKIIQPRRFYRAVIVP